MSTVWLIVSIVAVGIVAFANFEYQRVRDREKLDDQMERDARTSERLRNEVAAQKSAQTKQVAALLVEEIRTNLAMAPSLAEAAQKGDIQYVFFVTGAWQTVSSSSLILGIPAQDLNQLLLIYRLLNEANEIQRRLHEGAMGVGAAMQGPGKVKNQQLLLGILVNRIEQFTSTAPTAISRAEADWRGR